MQLVCAAGQIRGRTLFPRTDRGHGLAAVHTKRQARKEIFKRPFPATAAGRALVLYRLKGLHRDQRLMPFRYNDPFLRLLFPRFLTLEADLIRLPLHDTAQIDRIPQDPADTARSPFLVL